VAPLIAALDPVTGSVLVAIIGVFGIGIGRWVPKTRSESAVDNATARATDAEAWNTLVGRLREDITDLNHQLDVEREARRVLAAQHAECPQQIAKLQEDVARLSQALPRPFPTDQ